jgi:LacI family transcriptional regulator
MPPAPSSTPRRVGLRNIAEAAGVCLMTVSLSLRDSPKISAATRERIQRLARQLGYHPDPEISRLMKHLRGSRTAQGRTGLAILDFYPSAAYEEHVYHRCIREGAIRRADELGFTVTTFHAAEYHFNFTHLLKVVRSRGIEGLVLLPAIVAPLSLDPALDWQGLAVVSTTNSILSPRFHCVVPHQFSNLMKLIEAIHARGYQRIVSVFEEFFDERTAHNFTAALHWHHHGRRVLVVPAALAPAAKPRLISRWIARHEPDLIIAQSPEVVAQALATLPAARRRRLKIVGLGTPNNATYSYLDERPEQVGGGAVDLLAGMMYYHEAGVPLHARTTMIDGELRTARLAALRSAPRAPAAAG